MCKCKVSLTSILLIITFTPQQLVWAYPDYTPGVQDGLRPRAMVEKGRVSQKGTSVQTVTRGLQAKLDIAPSELTNRIIRFTHDYDSVAKIIWDIIKYEPEKYTLILEYFSPDREIQTLTVAELGLTEMNISSFVSAFEGFKNEHIGPMYGYPIHGPWSISIENNAIRVQDRYTRREARFFREMQLNPAWKEYTDKFQQLGFDQGEVSLALQALRLGDEEYHLQMLGAPMEDITERVVSRTLPDLAKNYSSPTPDKDKARSLALVIELMNIQEGEHVVEFGPGEGTMCILAVLKGAKVDCYEHPDAKHIESLKSNIAYFKEDIERAGGSINIHLADLTKVDLDIVLDNGPIDHWIAIDVFHPVYYDGPTDGVDPIVGILGPSAVERIIKKIAPMVRKTIYISHPESYHKGEMFDLPGLSESHQMEAYTRVEVPSYFKNSGFLLTSDETFFEALIKSETNKLQNLNFFEIVRAKRALRSLMSVVNDKLDEYMDRQRELMRQRYLLKGGEGNVDMEYLDISQSILGGMDLDILYLISNLSDIFRQLYDNDYDETSVDLANSVSSRIVDFSSGITRSMSQDDKIDYEVDLEKPLRDFINETGELLQMLKKTLRKGEVGSVSQGAISEIEGSI